MLVQTPRAGLRRRPGLRALPHARPLLGLPGPAAPSRAPTRPAALPLVRHRPPGAGPARCAATAGCAPRSSATRAPPRSSAGPSRRRRCGVVLGGRPVLADGRRRSRPIVVATPGAEPVAEGGYAAVVLLDTWLMLARPDLRTAEEAVRRWANAVGAGPARRPGAWPSATRPHPGAAGAGAVGPGGLRRARDRPSAPSAHLPPASRLATITGEPGRRRRRADAARAARGGRGARPGAGRPTARSGSWCGCPAPRAPALSRGPAGAAAGALGPQARRGPRPGRPDRLTGARSS